MKIIVKTDHDELPIESVMAISSKVIGDDYKRCGYNFGFYLGRELFVEKETNKNGTIIIKIFRGLKWEDKHKNKELLNEIEKQEDRRNM